MRPANARESWRREPSPLPSAKLEEHHQSIYYLSGNSDQEWEYTASLSSPTFEISPTTAPIARKEKGALSWEWLVAAQRVGSHALKLGFDKAVMVDDEVRTILVENANLVEAATQDSVTFRVNVVSSLGLTSRQEAWAKAVGAAVGILGTIFGFAFIKARFDSKEARAADQDPPDSAVVVALFLGANPTDATRLALTREAQEIDNRLRATEFRERLRVEQQWEVQAFEIPRKIMRFGPKIVHLYSV